MPRFPAADFSRVPYRIYTDPAVYAREPDRIFTGPTWSHLALEAEIPASGDYVTSSLGEVPVIVTRNRNGTVRAFVDRCAHRGAAQCPTGTGR
jgi:phenylpropionate dioxygenase-like ring-hydroxylating dioxygenase large terminal subunit